METLQLERLVDDPEIRRAAAKTLRGFCLTYLPHHFPADVSDFFDDYYDDPPFDDGNYLAHGVDLAISTKESADYAAIVSGEITWPGGKLEIYIQPHPIIRHMH